MAHSQDKNSVETAQEGPKHCTYYRMTLNNLLKICLKD